MTRSRILPRRQAVTTTLVGCLASLLLVPMLATSTEIAGAAPTATATSAEGEFLTRLNTERQKAGLSLLVSDTKLAPTSRSWSSNMASRNTLSHDPNLAAIAGQVEPAWRSVGENVGIGYSVLQLHDAFMASTGHRANIMKPSYNRVGIGVAMQGTKIWVTVRFLEGPAITGSTGLGPPPPPPGVRTVLSADFDGDGHGDLLTYQPGSAADELWFGRTNRTLAPSSVNVSGQYRPVTGDFDGDGRSEILWYVPGSTGDPMWEWNGSGWTTSTKSISGTYSPFTGDFDGDGRADIFWYAPGTAADSIWYGEANGSFTSVTKTVTTSYRPFVGNFDGTRGDDIFWYAPGTTTDYTWYSTGSRSTQTTVSSRVNGSYTPFTGDFDGNRTDDIFWYIPGSGADWIWYTTTTPGQFTSVVRTVTNSYLPTSVDFDGDSADDIAWFSPSSAAGDPLWWGSPSRTTVVGSSVHS